MKRYGLGKQLINPSVAIYGKYIDANGIEQMSSSGLTNHTDYISVTANRLYTVSYDKPPVSGNTIAISWYDSNKNFIIRDFEPMPFELGRYKFTKTAPNNAAFAIVNFTYFSVYTETQNTNNYIFAIGESQLPYEPYGNSWQTKSPPKYINGTWVDSNPKQRDNEQWV